MAEPAASAPPPPVSKFTLAGVGLFVVALVTLLLFMPDDETRVPPGEKDPAVIFAQRCAICHGASGEGKGRFKKIAGTEKTEAEIIQQLETGKGEMPPLEATPEQRAAVAKYVKSLK